MPQAVNSDTLLLQRRADLGGGQSMLVQHVLHTVHAEPFTFGAGKQHRALTSLWLSQPGFQDGECRFSDGRTAFLASLADDPYVSAGPEDKVLAFEPGHLGYAQTRLYGDQEEGVIAPAKPGVRIRSGQQGID